MAAVESGHPAGAVVSHLGDHLIRVDRDAAVDGAADMHGEGGEWRVENQRLHWEVLDHWRDAAIAWGLNPITDFNTGDN